MNALFLNGDLKLRMKDIGGNKIALTGYINGVIISLKEAAILGAELQIKGWSKI